MSKTKKDAYIVTMVIGSKTIKGEGETVYDALASMKRPLKITSKTMLKVKHGKYSFEKMYMPVQAKRFFYPIAQFFLAKQLEFLLK